MKLKEEVLLQRVPAHLRGGITDYVDHHIPTGSFLEAVLSNDLKEAFGRADLESRLGMYDIVSYLFNCAPESCWGSPEAYKAWLAKRKRE